MSNIHEFSDRSSIKAEAREWLIRLDSDIPLDGEEIEALRRWLDRSPAHRRELKRISKFWDSANVLTELAIPLNKSRPEPRGILSNGGFAAFAKYGLGTATIALLVTFSLIFTIWIAPETDTADKNIYASAIGQVRTVVLQDGSTVHLNTNSLIEVDYSGAARKIHLLRGESHFQVVSNSDKPFEVYANSNMVRAVGTAFSVHLLNDDVKVTVEEGKVELITIREQRSDSTGALRPSLEVLAALEHGQSATFNKITGHGLNNIVSLANNELDREFSWRRGVLSFSGEPLSEVVNTINRYTPKTIEIVDPELNALPVGGRFRVDELEEIFEVLHVSFGIRISRVGDQHILLRSEKEKQ